MIVENGTGLSNSTSYCAVAFADNYLRFEPTYSVWTAKLTADKEKALEYATMALDELNRWIGTPLKETQALGLPTDFLRQLFSILPKSALHDGLPVAVQKACALVALDYVNGKDTVNTTQGGNISSISVPDLAIAMSSAKSSVFSDRVRRLLSIYADVAGSDTTNVIDRW